jgi:hypothetical protein
VKFRLFNTQDSLIDNDYEPSQEPEINSSQYMPTQPQEPTRTQRMKMLKKDEEPSLSEAIGFLSGNFSENFIENQSKLLSGNFEGHGISQVVGMLSGAFNDDTKAKLSGEFIGESQSELSGAINFLSGKFEADNQEKDNREDSQKNEMDKDEPDETEENQTDNSEDDSNEGISNAPESNENENDSNADELDDELSDELDPSESVYKVKNVLPRKKTELKQNIYVEKEADEEDELGNLVMNDDYDDPDDDANLYLNDPKLAEFITDGEKVTVTDKAEIKRLFM